MTSSVQYIPGNWQVGDVVEVKGESTTLDRNIELLRYSWYLGKIKQVEDLIPSLPRFLVQLEDFGPEFTFWVTEEDFRLPLSYESIQDNEPVEIGQIVEIASSIDDGNGAEPISWWEATILEDKGQTLKVQFKNLNWHDEGQSWKLVDRMDIRKGEPHSSRSWRLETYHSLERTFMKKLSAFMKSRGTPLKYNGQNSLFKLFAIVTSMGGIKKVSDLKGGVTKVWKRCPNFSPTSTNGASTVKDLYIKLLKPFEEEFCKFSDDESVMASSGQRKRKVINPFLDFSDEGESDSDDEEFTLQNKKQPKPTESDTIVHRTTSTSALVPTKVDQATQTEPEMQDASTQTGVVVLFGKEVVV